jgi:preprotein translocase subunit YajC
VIFALIEMMAWLQPEQTGGGGGGAPSPGGAAPGGAPGCGGGFESMGLLVVMMVVFYFLLIRPQQKRQKEHDSMLKALKRGSVVRTSGGIRGEIVGLDDAEVTLLIADKVKINVLRANIAGLVASPDASIGGSKDKG